MLIKVRVYQSCSIYFWNHVENIINKMLIIIIIIRHMVKNSLIDYHYNSRMIVPFLLRRLRFDSSHDMVENLMCYVCMGG